MPNNNDANKNSPPANGIGISFTIGNDNVHMSPPNNQATMDIPSGTTSSVTNVADRLSAQTPAVSTVTAIPPSLPILSTPKKAVLNSVMLQTIREKLNTPGAACELHAMGIAKHIHIHEQPVKLVKDRYVITSLPSPPPTNSSKTPISYRHLIDLTSSNLKCVDIFSGEEFLCKVVNEPLQKVQRAYFQLQQDELFRSSIYGHPLFRDVHDIVQLSMDRTYVIMKQQRDSNGTFDGAYENLHSYVRHEKRLCEVEARAIFHQICQTVQCCHRNGVILRDLKLKRFYFVDEARTQLQYESLEGSMILDNPLDDTLTDKIGCPLYTAPELLCPEPTYQGKPADMWSLGVILYTMLVGQYPFFEKANCNLITIIRHGNVQIPISLSKSVRWLLLSLLRKNYTERITASLVFLSPWLKEQRPFHMYLPVNVEIADDWDEPEENANTLMIDEKSQFFLMDETYSDMGVEPLEYTHNSLQLPQPEVATDVDMG